MSSQGFTVATCTLALTASCLRFTARRLSNAGLWYDDWLIVPAMLLATTLVITTFLSWYRSDFVFGGIRTSAFLDETLWTVAIWIVKYSILAFYWRLFAGTRRSVRIVIWTLTAIVACWGIAVVASTASYCFVYSTEGFFFNNPDWLYVGSWVPHIFLDVVLLGLPVPLLWKLQMRRKQKAILTAIFACGGLVTIISIVRLVNVLGRTSGNAIVWSTVEVNSSIICACLPSLRPILSFISDKLKLLRDRKSTHKRGSKLLMDMLPVGKPASPVSPVSSRQSWNVEPHPLLDSSIVTELEANTPRAPELDAEAPGSHILEIETVEPALEMGSLRHIAELEGPSKYTAELR
ncbi:hypothetical protein BDR22DRAFT_324926 [Usnea florida]